LSLHVILAGHNHVVVMHLYTVYTPATKIIYV